MKSLLLCSIFNIYTMTQLQITTMICSLGIWKLNQSFQQKDADENTQ